LSLKQKIIVAFLCVVVVALLGWPDVATPVTAGWAADPENEQTFPRNTDGSQQGIRGSSQLREFAARLPLSFEQILASWIAGQSSRRVEPGTTFFSRLMALSSNLGRIIPDRRAKNGKNPQAAIKRDGRLFRLR